MKHPVLLLITLLGMLATLCHAVVITPQTTRPWLLSGPSDKEDIKARLAIFAYPQSTYIQAYLSGTEAEKQAATTVYFDQLKLDYTTEMGRRLQEDLFEYDMVQALGYVTPAQRQTLLDRTVYYINATFPTFPTTATDFTNLGQEKVCALGLAALNFPDHPDAQIWIDASVRWTGQFIDYYFPDGAGVECQRYHDWSLSLLGKYLFALRRCTDADLFGRPGIRHALDWMIRFTSPPLSVGSEPYTLPAWGDSNYGSLYYHLPVFANAFKDSDPDFSRRLMHWWRKTGSQVNSGWEFGTAYPQIFDPRLPDSPVAPVNTSTYSPYMGHAILRDDTDGLDGLFATFNCGYGSLSHFEADNGHLDLFAFGVPVAIDSMGGTYDASAFAWNRQTMAHNTVRCVMPEYGTALRTVSGVFQAFGASDIADYTVGNTSYGQTSVRHVVMVKGDYMVVWDQITAASYSDWFFHTPADTTRPDGGLEWQANKVISHTPWDVDLDIHFLLPANPLPAPTVATDNISIDYTTTGAMASEHPVPTTAKLYTGQGKGRFGDWTNPADPAGAPWNLKWLTYMVVRAPSADGDYLTVLHPRKVGVTPTLTTTLTNSTATSVSLTVNYNGRTDTIVINTSGATVTKGGYPTVQFSKTYPQSGVSGAARYVKADDSTTTLNTALTTTGTVDVSLGTLELGGNDRIPNTVPVVVRSGGKLNIKSRNDTVGKLTMDGGTLTGTSGTLTVSEIDWYGGTVSANVMCTGAFTKKGGALWSPSANITYTGDTIIESGALKLLPGGPSLPGTGRILLSSGTVLDLNGASHSLSLADLPPDSAIRTGTGTLTLTGSNSGAVAIDFSGNLVHAGSSLVTLSGPFDTATTLTLQSGASLAVAEQTAAALTAAAGSTLVLDGVFTAGGTSTLAGGLTGTGSLVATGTLALASTTTIGPNVFLGTSGSGKLDLPTGSTFTVPWLIIDGMLQASGSWNATRDPAHFSGGGTLVVLNDPLALAGPVGLTAIPGNAQVGLVWSPVPGAASYTIRRATVSGGPYLIIGASPAAAFTDSTAINSTTYCYVITVIVSGLESTPSAEVQATPGANIWTGTSTTAWETAGNWSAAVPASGNVAIFSGPLTTNQPSVSGANSVGGLLFDSPGWAINSTSAGNFIIGASGVVVNATSGTITLNKAATVLAGTRIWKGKTGSTLVMASMGGPTATSTLQWGDPLDPTYGGTLKLTYNGNGVNTYYVVSSGILQAHKSGWINSRDLTVSGGTFLVTYSNGDLIRSDYGVILNSGLINWNGFSEAFKLLTLNGGTMRGSGSTVSLTDLSGAIARISGNVTLGHADDANPLKLTRAGTNGSLDLGNAPRTITTHSPVEFALPITNTSGGLTKTGAGTLTFSATNTYRGGTDINAGTLVAGAAGTLGSGNLTVNAAAICDLRNPGGAVADTASVYLTGSAKITLAASVSESVAKLYIDGVLTKTGKWNASRDPVHFSGAGELVVTDGVPLTLAESWRQENFGSIENAGDSADGADPDKDGSVNLIERALGMNPNGEDSGNLPAIDATAAAFAFTFTKSRTATDLTIVVEESSALFPDSWMESAGTMELIDDSNAEYQRFRYIPTLGLGTRRFYHLWVRP